MDIKLKILYWNVFCCVLKKSLIKSTHENGIYLQKKTQCNLE